ncbi:MAG: FeoA domain-containing protein [Bdellovibrionota bacterium]
MTLAESPLDQDARITDLAGNDVVVLRLREIGFIRGEVVQVRGRAPFGDPIIVEVRGAMVALRKEEATCVKL